MILYKDHYEFTLPEAFRDFSTPNIWVLVLYLANLKIDPKLTHYLLVIVISSAQFILLFMKHITKATTAKTGHMPRSSTNQNQDHYLDNYWFNIWIMEKSLIHFAWSNTLGDTSWPSTKYIRIFWIWSFIKLGPHFNGSHLLPRAPTWLNTALITALAQFLDQPLNLFSID